MDLKDYLDRPGQTATALASLCDCSISTITRIAKRETTPSGSMIKRIVAATKGRVTVNDLIK